MWSVVKYINGVEVEDYGVIEAANIRQLVGKLKKRFGVDNLMYEKMDHFKSPVYHVFADRDSDTWLEVSKYN